MTDLECVQRFRDVVGVGYVYGPYEREGFKDHWKQMYVWRASKRADVRTRRRATTPWLSERRREQATIALGR